MAKGNPKISWDARLWDRLPWDTKKSYSMFTLYYLPQREPRSLARAYREYKGISQSTRGAPSNWHRWSGARDRSGRRQYCDLVMEDGSVEVRARPTWAERAGAFDAHLIEESLRRLGEEREEVLTNLRKSLRALHLKADLAITRWAPTGKETLAELSISLQRISADLRALYGISVEDLVEEAQDGGPPEGATSTDMDRVDEIARILAGAVSRKRKEGGA